MRCSRQAGISFVVVGYVGGAILGRIFPLKPSKSCVEVGLMALQAEKRFILHQEIVGHCAMSVVTDKAVFLDGGVLEDEGTLILLVAVQTKFPIRFTHH
jgi:hypothetical protein